MRILIVLLLTTLLSWACNQGNAPATNAAKSTDTLTYTYHTYRRHSDYFSGDGDRIDTAYYTITYPKFDREQVNTLIKPEILIDGENIPDEAAQSFIDAYNEYIEESSIQLIGHSWFKENNSRVITNTPLFFTLSLTSSEYMGGAHGNQHLFYTSFDVQQFKRITWSDLIRDEMKDDLTQLAERHFRLQENLSDTTSLDSMYFFDNNTFAINDNFALTKDKLIIFYNLYEIKSYADGTTRLEIPYTELSDMLTIKGKQYIESIK